ncbi:hypothetical protein BJX70DRAFT_394371 [Aspergillus crustosus]
MTSTKRKATDSGLTSASTPTTTPKTISFTARNPTWTYLKLQIITNPPTTQPIDPLTARTHLTSALSQFLGLAGSSIPIDILHVSPAPSPTTKENYIWIRVPRQDAPALVSALSSWIGGSGDEADSVAWRICAKGNFLGALVRGDGGDLFAS